MQRFVGKCGGGCGKEMWWGHTAIHCDECVVSLFHRLTALEERVANVASPLNRWNGLPVSVATTPEELAEENRILYGDPTVPSPKGIVIASSCSDRGLVTDPNQETVESGIATLRAMYGPGKSRHHSLEICLGEIDRLRSELAKKNAARFDGHSPLTKMSEEVKKGMAELDKYTGKKNWLDEAIGGEFGVREDQSRRESCKLRHSFVDGVCTKCGDPEYP